MSSLVVASTTASASVTASPSASTSASSSTGSDASTFYKNLFYILIGLLCAFGLVSFFSLMRARRRRNIVLAEAQRLGVIVPGIPGYVPLRDRQALKMFTGPAGGIPAWWEVGQSSWTLRGGAGGAANAIAAVDGGKAELGMGGNGVETGQVLDEKAAMIGGMNGGQAVTTHLEDVGKGAHVGPFDDLVEPTRDDFYPLGIIAPPEPPTNEPPVPQSEIPFFPNHLAYREESLQPRPLRFSPDDPDAYEKMAGESVGVVVLIRMPSVWSAAAAQAEMGSATVNGTAGPGGAAGSAEEGEKVYAEGGAEGAAVGNAATGNVGAACQEGEEVFEEWGGAELGIVRLAIQKSTNGDLDGRSTPQ